MSTTTQSERLAEREKQIKQAEEILSSFREQMGIAKGLYWGKLVSDWIFPYPQFTPQQKSDVDSAVRELTQFCDSSLDPTDIDRKADIPQSVISGLAHLGILGMTAPKEIGGRGFTQMGYCKLLEVIGGRCSSTSIFVNAHHSIGMRGLLLFGSEEQKRKWLPDMVSGDKIGAFALTEVNAGSDAANVQTQATLSEDGSHYILNGEKRYITNGAISDVLTVMARTPVPGKDTTSITAFLVTPDMPGFRVVEARMEKVGIRGTATARLAFENMRVPKENILGPLGKGLKVALTVLDFGRTTFGACCTGAAKTCLQMAIKHAKSRRQFNRTLAEFELVQQKIARMAAWTYAMEAMTTVTAGLIDRGLEDYMLETAMLKVWSTERLWTIVNEAFQIHGGSAYFTDNPLERMLRDHRINQIGEGANEVLMSFICMAGMRGPALRLKDVYDSLKKPWSAVGKINKLAMDWTSMQFTSPTVPIRSPELQSFAGRIGTLVGRFGNHVQKTIFRHREEVIERQLQHEKISWAAMELYASLCTLSRWDAELVGGNTSNNAVATAFLESSIRLINRNLTDLTDNDDESLMAAAKATLA